MGPNENWMSDVERELKRQQDQLTGLSINQLALQSQGNYELPQRTTSSDQQSQNTIWIRLTESAIINGRNLYSWREQVAVNGPSGVTWLDNGNSGTYVSEPATGLNNEAVETNTFKRYPAKFNDDTNEWIFFSNQQAASDSSFVRWNRDLYVTVAFNSLPTLPSGSANVTMDQAALDAGINFLRHCHHASLFRQKYLAYNVPNLIWDGLIISMEGKFNTLPQPSQANTTQWNAHIVSYEARGSVGFFPKGIPSGYYGGHVLANVPEAYFVPRVGFYSKNDYDWSEPLGDYAWDEYDPVAPGATTPGWYSASGNFEKSVWVKSYLANGTWNGSSMRQIRACGTYAVSSLDGINWSYNYGPVRGTVGQYTCNMSGGGFGVAVNNFNGTITVSWGGSTCSSSGISGAIDPTQPTPT